MATTARLDELKAKFEENPRRYFAPLANEFRKLGDLPQAISILRTHLPGQPGHVSGHIVLAQALHDAGELNEARAEFEAAIELDPENLIALRFMGDIARVNGEVQAARHWYQRVLETDPRNYEIAQMLRDLESMPNAMPPAAEAVHANAAVAERVDSEAEGATSHEQPAPEEAVAHAPATVGADAERVAADPAQEVPDLAFDLEVDSHTPNASSASPEAAEGSLPEPDVAFDLPDTLDLDQGIGSEPMAATAADQLSWPDAVVDDAAHPIDPPPSTGTFSEMDFHAAATSDAFGIESQAHALFTDDELAFEAPAPSGLDAPAGHESQSVQAVEGRDAVPAISMEQLDEPHDASERREPVTSLPVTPVVNASATENTLPDQAVEIPSPEQPMQHASEETFASTGAYMVEELGTLPSGPDQRWGGEPVPASDLSDLEAAPESWFENQHHAPSVIPASMAETPQPARESQARDRDIEALFSAPPNAEEPPREPEPQMESAPAPSAEKEPETDPMVGRTPVFTDAVRQASAPFATETLAQLYLQQGFRDEALAIYQQLLERNPSDETLRSRYLAVQSGEASDVLASAKASAPPSSNKKAAQSVRTFFGQLARRQPRSAPAPEPRDTAAAPRSSSSLTQLFAGESNSSADAAAAGALASAYLGKDERSSASAASGARSLDHLFQGATNSAVTLDEFYSTPDASGAPKPAGETPPDERQAEIKEFTTWLDGLKKK